MKLVKLFLVIIWMILIFCFSHSNSYISSDQSKGFIYKSIQLTSKVFNIEIEEEKIFNVIEIIEYPIRKCAHIFLYFVLAILIVSLFEYYNLNFKQVFIYSLLICLLYAVGDEIHQLFVFGRSGSINDVVIDSLGIYLGIFIKINNKQHKKAC